MAQEGIQKFGKYEILAELGRGAMGVVYKARDPLIGRLVALKTVMPGMLSDPDLLKRFYREAQSAGRLQHPNIVVIYDLGESNGLPYIAMELVEGESLQKMIGRATDLPLAAKLRLLVQICRGLGYAHQHGVVHRDVKPANILVTADFSVKVVDFGIVHLADTGMTSTGMILGTVSYMSPEQLRGEHVDARSDIFSVGIVMYELLSGQRPFEGANVTAILLNVATKEPQRLSELVPGIPPALEESVRKCLHKDPEQRYQSLEDLAFEIEPLARSMQRGVVDHMVQQGRDLLAQSDYAQAEEVLRNALALDSSHDPAKSLMAKVQTELRRIRASTNIQQYLEEGRRLMGEAKYSEASRAFEEILRLDSRHGTARGLLQQAREAIGKAEEVRKRLIAGKRALGEGDLTLAESELRKALELDKEQVEAAALLEKIREERAASERRLRLREGVSSARDLLRQERYDEALRQAQSLKKEFPEDEEVNQLLASARQRIEQREQVQGAFSEVKALLEQQKFKEAMSRAETVRFQFPADIESTRLYDFAKTESALAERRQRLELETTALQEQIKAQQYEAAIARGERLQQEFPGSVEVARLVALARSENLGAERQEQIGAATRSIQALRDAGRFAEAAREAKRAHERFPDDPGLARISAAVSDETDRQKRAATQGAAVSGGSSATSVFGGVLPGRQSSSQSVAKQSAYRGLEARASLEALVDVAPQPASLGARAEGLLANVDWRKRRVPIAVAAALLVLWLGWLAYLLFHHSHAQSGHTVAQQVAPSPSATASMGAIAGKVTKAGGGGVAGVQVVATDQSGREQSALSGADGSFRLDQLPPGTYDVRAQPPAGYASSPGDTVQLSGSQEQRVNLNLSPTGAGSGSAVKHAGVQADAGTQPSGSSPPTPTGKGKGELVVTSNIEGTKILIDGQDTGEVTPHTFTGIKPGNHGVAGMKDGYDETLNRVQVEPGGSIPVDLELSLPSGMLEFDTVPPGAEVEIDGKDEGTSPVTKKFTAGQHTYKVTLGTVVKEGTIEIRADGFTQKKVTIQQ